MVTSLSQQEIDMVMWAPKIKELTSTKSVMEDIHNILERINELVRFANAGDSSKYEEIVYLCLVLLEKNLTYYIEVSKVELIFIVAKISQKNGHDFKSCFQDLLRRYFNVLG